MENSLEKVLKRSENCARRNWKYLESWDRDEDLLGFFSNVMAQRMNMSFGV